MISDVPEEQLNSIKYKAIQLREYSKGLSTEECYTYKDYFRKDYGIFDCICFYTTSEQSLSNREEDENSERQYGKMNVCFVVKIKVFV